MASTSAVVSTDVGGDSSVDMTRMLNSSEIYWRFGGSFDGSTLAEIVAIVQLGPVCLLLRNLLIGLLLPRHYESWQHSFTAVNFKLALDFVVTVVPGTLALTYFNAHLFLITLLLYQIALVFVSYNAYQLLATNSWSRIYSALIPPISLRRPYSITYYRANMLILTCLCILAVDFRVFPRRFAKTDVYGYGLMDMGLGLFLVANALTSSDVRPDKTRLTKRLYTTMVLVVLGIVRVVGVRLFSSYHGRLSVYGIHWNFFFSIAAVKLIGSLLAECLPLRRVAGVLAVLTAVCYQWALDAGGLGMVLLFGTHGDDARDNFFDANREGIIELGGFTALYLAGLQLGALLQANRPNLRSWFILLLQLVGATLATYLLMVQAECHLGPPSRRLANLTYLLWLLFINLLGYTTFVIIELFTIWADLLRRPELPIAATNKDADHPLSRTSLAPCLWLNINRWPLTYFLVGNVLTGVINVLLFRRTSSTRLNVSALPATCIILLYGYALAAIVTLLSAIAARRAQHRR